MPPVQPMLAKSTARIPAPDSVDGGFVYEPKWDGFRAIVFRDGDEVEIGSRSMKPLTRYFPDVVEAVKSALPERCVVDGEIVVPVDGHLDFDSLTQRIHPADSRVRMLAENSPASLVVFDLLALEDDVTERTFDERRTALEGIVAPATPGAGGAVHLTQVTYDADEAEQWFHAFEGAGLDGIVAKARASRYVQNGRTMLKIKHARTADVVVAGYRLHKNSTQDRPLLGSVLLGLYASDGRLQHVGVCASFPEARRAALVDELAPLVVDFEDHPWGQWQSEEAQASGRLPGGHSRWTGTKDLSFTPLSPTRVAEVGYEHMEGRGELARFRHTAQFKRWRDDREPTSCRYDQLEEVARYDLGDVLR